MNRHVAKGFVSELKKEGAGFQTFKRGFKASIPFTLGIAALEQAGKPEHVSLSTPKEKLTELGKTVGTWGIGGGAYDVISEKLQGKAPKAVKGYLPKAKSFLKRLPKNVGRVGLGIGGAIAAEHLARKYLFGKRKPPKEIPLNPQPRLRKTASAVEPKKFKANLSKGQAVKAGSPKKISTDKIKMSKGTMKNVSRRTKDILDKVKSR